MGPGDLERFDAVVVGGGPAGSTAALCLARLGWRVALIERRPRGRAKACGNCLNPRGVRALERLGVAEAVLGQKPEAAVTWPTRLLRLHLPGEPPLESRLDPDGAVAGAVVDRGTFDDRLLDAAARCGVEVIRPATGRLVPAADGSAVVEVVSRETNPRRLGSNLMVGADGLGSRVARGGLPFCGRKVGFAASLAASPGAGDCPEPGVIEMVVVPGGYLGAVRNASGSIHVAGLIDLTHVRHWQPAELVAAAAAVLGLDPATASGQLGAAPMPWRPSAVTGPRTALIGDAAGYVEPFTGEGMGWALESAELLAESVAGRPPGSWDESAARCYRRSWQRAIGSRQRTCRVVASLVAHPRLVAVCPGAWRRAASRWLTARVMSP